MRALNKTELRDFLVKEEVLENASEKVLKISDHEYLTKKIDHLYFENAIFRTVNFISDTEGGNYCVCIFDEWGVWPSNDDKFTRKLLWEKLGASDVAERSAIVFDKNSFQNIASYVSFAFHCSWDCLVYYQNGSWFEFSHDGWIRWNLKNARCKKIFFGDER